MSNGRAGGRVLRSNVGARDVVFVSGSGCTLTAEDGRRFIDASSGVGLTCLGYDAPRVVRRMAQQAERLQFAHALRFETPPLKQLAERVGRLTPGTLNHSFFVSGGSEAVESAVKFARQYWSECGKHGKWRVVGRWPSFHGNTIASLSAGWHRARRARHRSLLLDFPHVEAPNSYRGCGHCRERGGCTLACADELERVVRREGADTIAAFIIEPISGAAGGAVVPDPGYFERVRGICDEHEILLIADEVLTGFGRTGRWFACDHWSLAPDVLVFAKGISAGFAPLGGFSVRDEHVAAFARGTGRFEHSFTMGGHAVSCAVGCAVLDEIEEQDLVTRVRENESHFFGALAPLKHLPLVGDVRGLGFLAAVELVADKQTKAPFPSRMRVADHVAAAAFEEGLIVYPCTGSADGAGDHLLLMPPFVMRTELFAEAAARLARALERAGAAVLA